MEHPPSFHKVTTGLGSKTLQNPTTVTTVTLSDTVTDHEIVTNTVTTETDTETITDTITDH